MPVRLGPHAAILTAPANAMATNSDILSTSDIIPASRTCSRNQSGSTGKRST